MSSNKQSTVIFMSPELASLGDRENQQRVEEMADILKTYGFSYSLVLGVWDNRPETSFMIPIKLYKRLEYLKQLATEFNQEAILEVAQNQFGFLHNLNGKGEYEQYIGKLVYINEDMKPYYNGYTTLSNGKSFVFKKGA